MTGRSGAKPGLFQGWRSDRDARSREARSRKVPLAITLPVTMAVSAALWVGLFLAVRALFW
jgi:hypothetical protein